MIYVCNVPILQMNGDAEKVTTNGDTKKDDDANENETEDAKDKEENKEDANETIEDAEKSTTSEKKKTSTKDKIKKRLSIRTINFLKRKKKENGDDSKVDVSCTFKHENLLLVLFTIKITDLLGNWRHSYNSGFSFTGCQWF